MFRVGDIVFRKPDTYDDSGGFYSRSCRMVGCNLDQLHEVTSVANNNIKLKTFGIYKGFSAENFEIYNRFTIEDCM